MKVAISKIALANLQTALQLKVAICRITLVNFKQSCWLRVAIYRITLAKLQKPGRNAFGHFHPLTEQGDKLVKRMKLEKLSTFKKKGYEGHYRFDEELASKFVAVKGAVKEVSHSNAKVIAAVEEGENLIAERNKLIRIADRSSCRL